MPNPADHESLGPYRLIQELGRGGQGVVWLAEDPRLGRKVALKVLSGLGPGAEEHLARFRREAALASKLEHPGICGVYDTGMEGGVPYIAMRYVRGETLAERISSQRSATTEGAASSFLLFDEIEDEPVEDAPEPTTSRNSSSVDRTEVGRVIDVFEKIAAALHAAHEVGIVHRDIKPGNVMLSEADGQPVILDFGLARDDSDEAGPSLTETGDVFGTPAYMSPEQISGRRVRIDRRTDIYSLGVSLYECLTMQRPFAEPTRQSLYQAILSKEPERARKLNRAIPGDLEVVLHCAMDKDRDRRYQTAADLAEDLRRVRAGEPILAKRVSVFGRAWRWSKRRPAAAALLVALALGIPTVSGLGAWWWTHRGDVEAQEQARSDRVVEGHLETGFYELHHGSAEAAVEAFEAALRENARSAEAIAGLTSSLLRRGDAEAALDVVERGEAAVDEPGILARMKARVLRQLGREAEASSHLEKAPEIAGSLMWFLEGTALIEQGHDLDHESPEALALFEEAALSLQRAVASSPRPRRAYHFQLAVAFGRLSDPRGAKVTARVIEQLWPDSALSWFFSGFATGQSDSEAALAAFRTSVRLDPENPVAVRNIGSNLHRLGRQEEAVSAYREALRLAPGLPATYELLSLALIELGRLDEAVTTGRAALRLEPDDAGLHNNLGTALNGLGRHEKAVAAFREAIRLDPEFAKAHDNLGIALTALGRGREAVPAYQEAVRLDPEFAQAHYNLGNALESLGRLEEAVSAFRAAIRIEPEMARAHVNLGQVLSAQGHHEEAVASCREAIRLDPKLALAHLNLGSALLNQGFPEEAIAAYREAIRLDPEDTTTHYNLAVVLASQGHSEEAAAAYRKVIHLAPNIAEAHCNLGNLLRRDLGELAEGLAVLRRGHDLGMKRGKAWGYPSIEWLQNAVIARARELRKEGDSESLVSLLEEYTKAYPEMSKLLPVLRQARRHLERERDRDG